MSAPQKHNVLKVVTAMLDEEIPAVDAEIAELERRLDSLRQHREYLTGIAALSDWKQVHA